MKIVRSTIFTSVQRTMKVIKVYKEFFGPTDVTLHVPEFENFGKRLDELERLADEANPIDPAEVEAFTAQMKAQTREHQKQARKKLKAMPAGPKKEMHRLMLGILEHMADRVNEPDEEEEEQEAAGEAEPPAPRDFQHLSLSLPKGLKWNKATQALVQQFFGDWPQTRPVVLQAIFKHYKKSYRGALTLFPGHKGLNFILPEPTSPDAVADLFYITSIYLHRDGSTGLSGNCTWDEEHGWGLMLKSGKVTAVGQADVAFC